MRAIWIVARRELRAVFDHPTGYILLIAFAVANNFLFFRQAYLLGVASLRPMLDLLPWLLLVLVPAVTMRTISEDTRTGTIEVVLAQPLTELEFLLGKYLGAVLFLCAALAGTLVIPVGLSLGADIPWGLIVAQYVGAVLLIAGLAGVGVWASTLTPNQIVAFIVGVAVMFVLVLVGLNPLIVGLPPALGAIAAQLGVLSHFANIGRGVIDLRDVIYFVSLAVVFLFLAYGTLRGRRLSSQSATHNRLRAGVVTLVAVTVVVNLLGGYIRGRLDLTPGKAYTLSSATRQLVANLDDLVTVKLFVSEELPTEWRLLKRDIDDVLRDLRNAGRGNVRLVVRDPATDAEAREEATSFGIPQLQFQAARQSEVEIRDGYLGMAIQYADGVETIPAIRQTEDLEYRLASAISSMTKVDTLVVGLASLAPDPMQRRPYEALRGQLAQRYDVRMVELEVDSEPAGDFDVLVLAGNPETLSDSQVAKLGAFFTSGGRALVMTSGMTYSMQPPFAQPRTPALNRILAPFGVSVRSDMVYDLQSNQHVGLPTQFGRVFIAYPFFVQAASTRATVMNQEIGAILLPWTSTVDTAQADSGTVTPLFVSSPATGVSASLTPLDPRREFTTDSLARRVLAVAVVPRERPGGPAGRVVVVGNGEFASDPYVRDSPTNVLFALNAIDWLAEDEGLIRIRSKNRQPPVLSMSDGKRDGVRYANVVGVPLLIALAAVWRMVARRRKSGRVYRQGGVS